MDRMKRFLIYALCIIGFFAISLIVENVLLLSMYSQIKGEFNGEYETDRYLEIENAIVKACSVNGYMNFDIINSTGKHIDKCYLKIELYNKQKLLSDTDYVEIQNLEVDANKHFNIKFKANNIETFKISVVKEAPDMSNIISVFGWETDMTNVFGLGIDLTEININGNKLTDFFTWDNMKATGINIWKLFVSMVTGVPLWAYGIAWMIIVGVW